MVGIFALSSSPLPHLWRPLIVALGFTLVIVLVVFRLSRGERRAQLIAGTIALALLAAWPFVAMVAVMGVWRFTVDRLRRRQARQPVEERATPQILRIANGFGWVVAAVTSVNVVLSGGLQVGMPPAVSQGQPVEGDLPNIYLVLLDGYPRHDTLLTDFGYDNSPFLAELESRGFDVAVASRSNYTKTLMTLASVLNMDYTGALDRLSPPADSAAAQARQLSGAINDSASIDMLRDRGYEIAASGSAFGEAALMAADVYFEPRGLTKFEEQIARFTWLAAVLDVAAPEWIADQSRQSVRTAFSNWRSVAERHSARPTFMLTHVLSPHTPFLFADDGSARPIQSCFPSRCGLWETEMQRNGLTHKEYTAGLTGQLKYLNGLILETVDAALAADPNAVVVLFSDHGIRHDATDRDEYFRSFLASRTPGFPALLPEDTAPVNILPQVFNAYLDADLPIRPYEAWWSREEPLSVERYPAER